MTTELRKTGISILDDLPWGTHFCHFYETGQDLLDILIPFFRAGLERNEFCLWVVADPFTAEEARDALRRGIPEAEHYLSEGRVEIIPHSDWYLKGGGFDAARVVGYWNGRLDEALARGFAGLRGNGIMARLLENYHESVIEFERALDESLTGKRMLLLCSYPLSEVDATVVFDVVQAHEVAVVRRGGAWEAVENAELKRARREIEKLNEELEQRVVERTRELAAANEELRREIARREQVEELLRTRERHFRTIIENSADGIALFSPDGSIRYASPSTPRVLGYTPEELVSFNAFDLVHPEDHEAVRQGINAILGRPAASADVQVRVRHKDGEWRWLEGAFMNMIDEPHVGAIVNNFRDITEHRRADDLLRQSEYQLAEAQRLARLGSWTLNLDDNVLTWSDELYRIYGLDPREFTPTYDAFMRLVHPEDVDFVAKEVERSVKNLEPLNYRLRIIRPDGEVRILHSRGRVATDERSVPFRLYGAAQDVTEQKRAEEQLRQTTEQLRALSARLRSAREEEAVRIAREIHDELGAALSSLRWDLEEVGEVVSEAADAPRAAALRRKIADMMGLTDAAVNTVRRIASELRPTALDQLGLVEAIEWQAQQFQERTGIVVNCDCALESDDLTQEQSTAIFRNFQEALTNVLRHAQATRVDITAKKEADEFVLTVSDNGRGITEEEQAGLPSLGLLGMRERANLIGGKIQITGVEGKGTVVTLRVPVSG